MFLALGLIQLGLASISGFEILNVCLFGSVLTHFTWFHLFWLCFVVLLVTPLPDVVRTSMSPPH